MKDASRKYLEGEFESNGLPLTAKEAVDFCLDQLFKDKKHHITEEIANRLTYEELIGALLAAQRMLQEPKKTKRLEKVSNAIRLNLLASESVNSKNRTA